MTLNIKVNHQGQVIIYILYDIPDYENVRIDTNIESIASILLEISKVI